MNGEKLHTMTTSMGQPWFDTLVYFSSVILLSMVKSPIQLKNSFFLTGTVSKIHHEVW